MINIKKSAVVLAILLLCISIIGCSKNNAEIVTTSTTSTTAISTSSTTSTLQTTKAEVSTTVDSTTRADSTTKKATTTTQMATTNHSETVAKTTTKKAEKSTTKSTSSQATVSVQNTDICYITIECSEINKNIKNLKAGHEKYVPKNGIILDNYVVEIGKNYTVYDVLNTACNDKKINLTSTSTQYGKYIAGINNLDERDCGQYSGWLYYVNGEKPSFSVSKYNVKSGDKIVFSYTCGE